MSSRKFQIKLPVYGRVYLPNLIQELLQTDTMNRLQDIGLTILPEQYSSNWASSRYWHSLQVAYLMTTVIRSNPNLPAQTGRSNIVPTLIAAALLHDAASTPCSHLVEPILKEVTGRNIEQRLPDFLQADLQLMSILKSFNVDFDLMCQLVSGQHSLSNILSGTSLDIDNLDNIYLVAFHTQTPIAAYNPVYLASSFRLSEQKQAWCLPPSASHHAENWQIARHQLYTGIDKPHILSPVVMLRYCVATAHLVDLLPPNFFNLVDNQLVEELQKLSVASIQDIFAWLNQNEFLPQVWELKLDELQFDSLPPDVRSKLRELQFSPTKLVEFSDILADSFCLPKGHMLMYVGSAKTYRPIHGLFTGKQNDGASASANNKLNLRVYAYPGNVISPLAVTRHLQDLGLDFTQR